MFFDDLAMFDPNGFIAARQSYCLDKLSCNADIFQFKYIRKINCSRLKGNKEGCQEDRQVLEDFWVCDYCRKEC